jgi:pyrroloquinoline quinone biosynthesis protein D
MPESERAALKPEDVVELQRLFRLQWEDVQKKYVLLYPEGMVQLNQSAGEILKRCDGVASIGAIIKDLEQAFGEADLKQDVLQFMEVAYERGWIHTRQSA